MNEKTLWLASFKSFILKDCPIDFDGSEFMYGEAAGFAESENQFKLQLDSMFSENKLELLETYHLSLADQAMWVLDSVNKEDILELLEEVQYTGNFSLGILRSSRSLDAGESST